MEKKGDPPHNQRFLQKKQKSLISSCSKFTSNSAQPNLRTPKTLSPNKAVFTIDAKTGIILIVNNNACQLLGFQSSELCKKNFFDLIVSHSKNSVCALAEMQFDSENGTMTLLSGKVVEMNTKNDTKVAVSLWMRQIDNECRCLAVAEPVERRICEFHVDRTGLITYADREAVVLFQFESINQIIGLDIKSLIPAIKLPDSECSVFPKHIRKQKATGRTADCVTFPLCLLIASNEIKDGLTIDGSHVNNASFTITVWVFQNLSGLIIVDETGHIQSCNHHFSLLMFGYPHEKIINMPVTSLIPNFCNESIVDCRSRNMTNSSLTSEDCKGKPDYHFQCDKAAINKRYQDTSSDSTIDSMNSISFMGSQLNTMKYISRIPKSSASALTISTYNGSDSNIIETDTPNYGHTFRTLSTERLIRPSSKQISFSQSKLCSSQSNEFITRSTSTKLCYKDGKFKGEAIHADCNVIDIVYVVSTQILPCLRKVYCIWICRDPDTIFETDQEKNSNLTLTFNSIASTIDYSLGQIIKTTAAQNSSGPNSISIISSNEDEQIAGDFNKNYTTLKQIGKGAYGFVKMAYRNTDHLLVITKFIFKNKLCSHFMVVDDQKKEIPIEIYVLRSIKHTNIVTILDVFENEHFFQLVMEKHGSGMDLFEFIERRPLMDEKLGSYIFRQIASAVSYLHSLNILHRDIKDENIIIDQNFHVKLIDFGSATFMEKGKLFSTFFGTTEYCSPEVLAGNKYAGPELEMWSLGITLYVLMFFENPFVDIDETLKAELEIPQKVSSNLQDLLYSMLTKDPLQRCSMSGLMENPWLHQEVNPLLFNFSWIVPCEPYESNPEKYYVGRISSSTTALSTMSPQESLSLVDESSAIDIELEDADISPSQRNIELKGNEHNSWSENINSIFSVESLHDEGYRDTESFATNLTSRTTASNFICENKIPCLSNSSQFQRNYSKQNCSLSKMNVSDFALDIKTCRAFKDYKFWYPERSKYFGKTFPELTMSKSETNICNTEKKFWTISSTTLSSNSLQNIEPINSRKLYTTLVLNKFSKSHLENKLIW